MLGLAHLISQTHLYQLVAKAAEGDEPSDSFIRNIFTADFMPHGHCFFWKPEIVWLHSISDFTIGFSYFLIAGMLFHFVRRKRTLVFQKVFLLFGGFILLCGATHFLEILTLWVPVYRLDGLAKALTAAISLWTAILLVPLIPQALALKSNDEFEKKNRELQTALDELQKIRTDLEFSVEEKSSKLGKAEGLLQAIFDNSPSLIWVKDQKGHFLRVNRALLAGWGVTQESLLGKTDYELYPDRPDIATQVTKLDQEVLALNAAVQREERVVQRGEEKVYLSVKFPVPVGDGAAVGVGGIAFDVTERKVAERTAARLRDALESASTVGLAITDLNGRFLEVNPAYCRITGYTREELLKKPFYELNHPEDNQANRAAVKELLNGTIASLVAEKRYIRKDGGIVWVRVSGSAGRDEMGVIRSMVALAEDITARKQTEQALKESEVKFRNLANSIPQLAWMANADGSIFWYNNRWFEYTGATMEEMENGGWQKVHHPDHAARIVEFSKKAWPKGEPFELIFPLRKHTGEFRWFLTRANPIRDEQGRLIRWFGTNTDIEDQIKSEQVLKAQAELLERSNTELAQFAFVASHDLKEPLRVVANYTQLLQQKYQDRLDPEADIFVEHITSSVKRMYALLNDLLGFARVGAQDLNFEKVDCNQVLAAALANLEAAIAESHAEITVQKLPEVFGDEIQLLQVFQNLLSNAIKYRSKDTTPHIDVSAEELPYFWKFRIKDNGIGIKTEYLEKVFVLFQRLHRRDEYAGTGIGLSVCKRIVERHEGEIGVYSEFGKGSIFYFTLPKVAPSA